MNLELHKDVMDFHLDDDDRSESKIQTSIMRYIKISLPHANFVKIAQGRFSKGGISDIIGCYRGNFVALEVKRSTTKPTALQLQYLNDTVNAGGYGAIVRSAKDVEAVISLIDEDIIS